MNIEVTPSQARILNAICRTGHPKRAALDLNMQPASVQMALMRIKQANNIKTTFELVLEWDRKHRTDQHGTE